MFDYTELLRKRAKMVEFDKILEEMGQLSRRQWIQILLMVIPSVVVASQMGAIVYLGAQVEKQCKSPNEDEVMQRCNESWINQEQSDLVLRNEKGEINTCERYDFPTINMTQNITANCSNWQNISQTLPIVECSTWIYNQTEFASTIATEFDLVCGDSYKTDLAQSIYMVGVTIGCTFWGQVSDRYGRKISFVASAITGTGFATAVAFSNSYLTFVTLRAISGFCYFSTFITAYVLATEIVPPKHRVRVGQACQAMFALGFCLLALYGYLIREWRTLQLVLSIPAVILVAYYWILFESPRWLISTKRLTEAYAIVKTLLKSIDNKKNIEEVNILKNTVYSEDDKNLEKKEKPSEEIGYTPIDLVRTPNMRSKSIKLFYCWMVCSCVYYGLTLNSAKLGGDPYINLFLSGFVEIPAVFLCIPMLERWGRRPSLAATLIVAGCSCTAMFLVPQDNNLLWLNITLSMIGKFSIASAFGTVYIYAAELYPTPIRNVGMGVCSSSARVGGIISPLISFLSAVAEPLPYIVFGGMSIAGGFVALFLPEVLGIRLPETMQEGEDFGKNEVSILTSCCRKLFCCDRTISSEEGNNQVSSQQYDLVAKDDESVV